MKYPWQEKQEVRRQNEASHDVSGPFHASRDIGSGTSFAMVPSLDCARSLSDSEVRRLLANAIMPLQWSLIGEILSDLIPLYSRHQSYLSHHHFRIRWNSTVYRRRRGVKYSCRQQYVYCHAYETCNVSMITYSSLIIWCILPNVPCTLAFRSFTLCMLVCNLSTFCCPTPCCSFLAVLA